MSSALLVESIARKLASLWAEPRPAFPARGMMGGEGDRDWDLLAGRVASEGRDLRGCCEAVGAAVCEEGVGCGWS